MFAVLAADCRAGRGIDAEPNDPNNREDKEKQQDDELRPLECRFGLCRSQRMQRGYFEERLHDEDKDIEIESDHRADNVDPAPGAGEVLAITEKSARASMTRDIAPTA